MVVVVCTGTEVVGDGCCIVASWLVVVVTTKGIEVRVGMTITLTESISLVEEDVDIVGGVLEVSSKMIELDISRIGNGVVRGEPWVDVDGFSSVDEEVTKTEDGEDCELLTVTSVEVVTATAVVELLTETCVEVAIVVVELLSETCVEVVVIVVELLATTCVELVTVVVELLTTTCVGVISVVVELLTAISTCVEVDTVMESSSVVGNKLDVGGTEGDPVAFTVKGMNYCCVHMQTLQKCTTCTGG